ncbi:MAG TPA: hypothetical protein VFC61_11080 [Blastocatellia bacterium]|nr:hypothetical protein [Blastocatellia bacterium]
MSADLMIDVFEQGREIARLSSELGRLTADCARLAAAVADLKRDWPTDPAHFVIVDDVQVN